MSAGVLTGRSARGATALRGGRRWRPSPYQAAGFVFWLVMSLAYWRVPLCCEAGQHAAVVERLRDGLLHPRHPMADLPGAGSHGYTPYAVAEGVFARLTGLSGRDVLRLAGPVNLVVLLTGAGRFVRALTPRPWAPVLALAAMTLLWGTEPGWGSGELGLLPLTGNLGDPAAFAIGLILWAWALTATHACDGRRMRFVGPSGLRGFPGYAVLGALYGVILLVHPVASATAVTGGAAIVAGLQRGWGRAVAARWAVTGAAALLTALVWPYFDVFAPGAVSGGLDAAPYLPAGQVWLALLGLPALWARWRRSARDPLVLMCAAGLPPAVLHAYGPVLASALVPAQFALAVELAAPRPWGVGRRVLGAVAAGGACLGLLTAQAGAVVPRSLDPVGFPQAPRWTSYDWAARHIPRGEVVLTDGYFAVRSLAGYGVNLVAPPWPDASLAERERLRRTADVRGYLAPGSTPSGRAAVVRRRHVRWLLLTRRQPLPPEAVVVAWSRRTGEVLARVGGR